MISVKGTVVGGTPTNADPTFTDGASTARDFNETIGNTAVSAAANIGTPIAATDTDTGDTLTYSLTGTDAAKFGFNTGSGQITTKAAEKYDHEAKASYSVTVGVSDGAGGSATSAVTLNVTDQDEAPLTPVAPTVTPVTGSTTALAVSWTAPANTGRPGIDTYDLRYQKTTESTWTNGPEDRTGTGTSIGSLDAGTAYRVQVRATNAEGDSEWSSSGSGTTNAAATPTVSISADKTTAVFKEDAIVYTLTRTGSTTGALAVSVTLTQTKSFLLPADLTKTVTIAANQSTKTFTVAASSFQHFAAGTAVEAGTLTAEIVDGTDYDLGTEFAVDVAIVIGMTVRLDMASYSVGEADGTLSFEVIARTGAGAPQPSAATGSVNVFTEDGSANHGIDIAFTDAAQNFQPGEFSADGGEWQAVSMYDVSITNDALDEDDETFNLVIERNLAFLTYSLVDASGNSCGNQCTVTVTITDDDTAGVTVSKTALTVTEQDTTGDSYTVVLDSQPTADVTISIGGQTGTGVTAAPSPMTFTPMNWGTAQTVTVTADDDTGTTNDTVSLTHSVTASTDTDYSGITIAGVTVTVEDNDTAQVMGVMVTEGNAQLVVNWTATAGATGYKVQWKSGGEVFNTSDRQAAVASGSTTTHTISSLANGTEYTVRVIATRTGANDGSPSDEVLGTPTSATTAPDPPTDLTANAKGETQVDLSWTAPADNGGEAISGYKVEVSTNGTTTWSDLAADTASTDTTYSHTGLAAGNTRHYRVSAINSVDTGDASGVAGATTAAANVLVSNTGRSVDPAIPAGVATGDQDKTHSQGFDTGPNPGGYSLASVGVYVSAENLAGTEAFTVHIYTAASNGTLDTLQHTLTSPASYTDNAVNTFTAPAGATLDASTDYFVVFEGTANAALDFVLGVTASNAQDGGTRVGWAIENARRFNSVTSTSGKSFQISVNGTAIPTPMPSNSGLVPTGLASATPSGCCSSPPPGAPPAPAASAPTTPTSRPPPRPATPPSRHTARVSGRSAAPAVKMPTSIPAPSTRRPTQGVPIYWLNGAKAADDYADFYDGDWDEEAALKDESGTAATTTGNYPWTGCDHDGTELSGDALGSGSPVLGAPDSSFGTDGPISSSFADSPSETRPLYGLSELFAVAAAVVPNNAPTFPSSTAARSVAENTAAGQNVGGVLTATDSDGDTLTYTLEGTDAASFALVTTTDRRIRPDPHQDGRDLQPRGQVHLHRRRQGRRHQRRHRHRHGDDHRHGRDRAPGAAGGALGVDDLGIDHQPGRGLAPRRRTPVPTSTPTTCATRRPRSRPGPTVPRARTRPAPERRVPYGPGCRHGIPGAGARHQRRGRQRLVALGDRDDRCGGQYRGHRQSGDLGDGAGGDDAGGGAGRHR